MAAKRLGQGSRFFRWFFIAVWLTALVSACEPIDINSPGSLAATCQPGDGSGNIYQTGMFPYIKDIIERANAIPTTTVLQTAVPGTPSGFIGDASSMPSLMPTSMPNLGLPPQQDAFLYLVNETMHTTDTRIVRQDNSDAVHIVITFLSPKLIQAAYLNDFLYRGETPSEFESRLSTALSKTVKREEFLFLVTLIPANRTVPGISNYIVEVTMDNTTLMDSSGTIVKPTHVEYNLKQPFHTQQPPESGLMGYPMGLQTANGCASVLDPIYNTTIVIATESIQINGIVNEPHSWTIPYAPLVLDPEYSEPPLDSLSYLNLIPNPPTPLFTPPSEVNAAFWVGYAQFIWGKITKGNY